MNPSTFIMATPTLFKRMAEFNSAKQLLSWDELPKAPLELSEIKGLRMMQKHDERPSFPASIYNLPNLQELSMPIDFAGIKHPQEWAARIRVLDYSGREGGRSQVPESLCFQGCERLNCTSSELLFASSSFPSIKSLGIQWPKQKRHIQTLLFEQLEHLQIDALPSFRDLSEIHSERIHTLYLSSSRMEDLNGIERFSNLVKLGLNSFSKLSSLQNLALLKSLQCLDILYCPKLNDLETIVNHTALEEVTLVCSHVDFEPWREIVMKGRFKQFSATGPNYFYQDEGKWIWPAKRKTKPK